MITRTTEAAFRILLHLLAREEKGAVSVARLAEETGGSPTYLAKVAQILVRGRLLAARRGIQGGLELAPHAARTPLLKVVELCQGLPNAAYCDSKITPATRVCGYHRVMADLHGAVLSILGGKTVGDLASCPFGTGPGGAALGPCRMHRSEAGVPRA